MPAVPGRSSRTANRYPAGGLTPTPWIPVSAITPRYRSTGARRQRPHAGRLGQRTALADGPGERPQARSTATTGIRIARLAFEDGANDSAVHVDLVPDVSEDARLEIDGEVVQRDGSFRWEEGFEGVAAPSLAGVAPWRDVKGPREKRPTSLDSTTFRWTFVRAAVVHEPARRSP